MGQTHVSFEDTVQMSEKRTNLVHLINLGTERELELHLVDYEPKLEAIFDMKSRLYQDCQAAFFTFDGYVEFLHNELRTTPERIKELNILKNGDKSMIK